MDNIPWPYSETEVFLKKIRNIHRKTPVLESFYNKNADLKVRNFIKKRLIHGEQVSKLNLWDMFFHGEVA